MADKVDISLLPASIADHWKGTLSHLSLGQERTRYWWVGAGERRSIDGWMESFQFDDQSDLAPVITGSATMRQSLGGSPMPPIQAGNQIICELSEKPGAAYRELVRMRVEEPQRLATGQFTFQLANDASLLATGKDSWHFPHNKAHPGGWFPWQVVEEVGRRSRVPIVMPKVGKRIKKFPPMLNSTPIDVINTAMKHVRDVERKTLITRYQGGTMYLTERHYSPELMVLGPQLIDASLVATKREGWATDLTVRTKAEVAHGKTSKGTKKTSHRGIVTHVTRASFVRQYGYVHLIVYAHGATSAAEARRMGLAHMARVLNPKRTLTLTTPLIPGLRRGAYIRLAVPTLGLTQIVYVQAISYSASAGSLTMDVTCGFEDPVLTPPVDRVNQSTRGLASKKTKKTNPVVNSAKRDTQTAKPYVAPPLLGTVASK